MEIESNSIFQVDDELVKNSYNRLKNYEIFFKDDNQVQKDLCVIYFSSNEIYYPNTTTSFTKSIIEKDKYEWRNNLLTYAHKHIFLRDIQKQWYIEGINHNVNTPEKVFHLLRSLTRNYRVYAIGSSAGGYAAMLFGSMLNAERVYSFNAQFDLNIILRGSTSKTDPLLFKYSKKPAFSAYFKLDKFVRPNVKYFYFQSCYSQMDIEQYNAFSKKEIVTRIPFKTTNHGFPFLRHNLEYVMSLPTKSLQDLSNNANHPIGFSIRIDGLFKTFYLVAEAIFGRIRKKARERHQLK